MRERGSVAVPGMGAGGGVRPVGTPLKAQSIARPNRGFVVVESRFVRVGILGRGPCARMREDATVAGVVGFGTDWMVRSGEVLWTVDGIEKLLKFAGKVVPRKKEAGAGEAFLEQIVAQATNEMSEMCPDDGRRVMLVKGHAPAARWVYGQILGQPMTVRALMGLQRPPLRSEVVVRPMCPGKFDYFVEA